MQIPDVKGDKANCVLAAVAGGLTALTILAGRWGLYRVFDIAMVGSVVPQTIGLGLLLEVRLLSVLCLCVVTFISLFSTSHVVSPGNAEPVSVAPVLTALLSWLALSGFWSDETALMAYKLYELFLLALLFGSIIVWCASAKQAQTYCRFFWWSLVLGTTTLVCVSLPQVFASAGQGASGQRLSVLGGGPNVFGRYVDICILACLLSHRSLVMRIPLIVFFAALLVLSGSRGAVLGLCAAFVVCSPALVFKSKANPRLLLWLTPSLLAGGAVAFSIFVYVFPDLYAMVWDSFQRRFIDATFYSQYTSNRDNLFLAALGMIEEHPLLGHGLSGWGNTWDQPYPHNLFLEVTVEGGFVGLLLLLGVGWKCCGGIYRRIQEGRVRWEFVGLTALMLTSAQFSGDLFDSRTVFVSALLSLVPVQISDGADAA